MEPSPRQTQPTNEYKCSTCQHTFGALKTADHHKAQPPRVGDVLYCSVCGTVNRVRAIGGLEAVPESEINTTWSPEEIADLRWARKRVAKAWQKLRENN